MRVAAATALMYMLISLSSFAHAQVTPDLAQARALVDSGMKHFNAREYSKALDDFRASYDIVATPLAAALIAQTQANVEVPHASVVINWIATAATDASTQPVDKSTWAAFVRACNAAFALTSDIEASAVKLKETNGDLAKRVADLTAENKRLREQFSSLKAKFDWMEANLSKRDTDLLKDKCVFGQCED